MLSAISDVKRAIPDATLIEATPDFVGVSDIASLLSVSRQYIRKIIQQNTRDFPLPMYGGNRAIWHLEPVLAWLVERKVRQIDDTLLEISRVNMRCNHIVDRRRLQEDIPESYVQAVG